MTDDQPLPGAGTDGRPLLLLLAHHDDEVFCAARIEQARRARRRLVVVWATAGGIAPARRRMKEGRRVARLLRIADGDAVDLAFPDLGALDHAAQILAAARTIADGLAGVEILTTAYEGGHPDHDVMNLVAARLCAERPDASCREFFLYRAGGLFLTVADPWRVPPERARGDVAWLPLDRTAAALRGSLIRANSSQLPISLPLMAGELLTGRLGREPARPLPAHDYTRPPAGRRPLYERYTKRRFAEFARVAQALGAC
jgi:LmbE family N-acetylglucosaminyl deacetylase